MRKLIRFFLNHSSALVYLCYVTLGLVLLFRFNAYQQSVGFTSAGRIAGSVYSLSGAVTGYFGLQRTNNELLAQNGKLQDELAVLRDAVARAQAVDTLRAAAVGSPENSVIAKVINNSVSRRNNYITLDKGKADGIAPEMGLADQNGVVGVVAAVSPQYAVALSLLNPNLRISCKIKRTGHIGSLSWRGEDVRYAGLDDLAEYIEVNAGDTVVTSGYSAAFPEGLIVGFIEDVQKVRKDRFYSLTVRLAADFSTLNFVRVIDNRKPQELVEIEKEVSGNE